MSDHAAESAADIEVAESAADGAVEEIEEFDLDDIEVIESKVFG